MGDAGDVAITYRMKDNTGRGTASAKRNFSGLERQLKGLVAGFSALMVARAVAAEFGKMVRVTARLEQSIKDVGLISNATAGEFDLLKKKAKELGAATQFTALEAAEAMKEFARAGFTATETTDTMSTALEFASATGASLTQASTAMVATIKSYGLTAQESAKLSDLFASAINNSRFSAESLNEALKFGAPAGAAFEQSTEDMTAALAALVDVTGQGSMAGTAYRQMLIRATNVTSEGAAVLEKYKLTVQDISPELNSMGEVFKTLADAGISAGDAVTIFGARAGPAIASVSKRIREGTLDWDDYADAVTKSVDAGEQAIERLDTLEGSLTLFSSAWESLRVEIGDKANPTLKATTLTLTEMIRVTVKFSEKTEKGTNILGFYYDVLTSGDRVEAQFIARQDQKLQRLEAQSKMIARLIAQGADLHGIAVDDPAFWKKWQARDFDAIDLPEGLRGPDDETVKSLLRALATGGGKPTGEKKGGREGRVPSISREVDALKLLAGEFELLMAAEEGYFLSFRENAESAALIAERVEGQFRVMAEEERDFLAKLREDSRESASITKIQVDEILKLNKEAADAFTAEGDKLKADLKSLNEQLTSIAVRGGAQIMQGIISGIKGERDAFKDTIRGLLPLIGQALGLALTAGNPLGGAAGGAFGSALGGLFHQGGVVRAHQGSVIGGHRGVPVLAQEGESFLTPEVTADLGEDAIRASNRAGRFLGGGGGGGVNLNFYSTTLDRNSIRSAWRDGIMLEELERAIKMGLIDLSPRR